MHEKKVLPNGMRILAEEVPGVRSASLGIWVQTGSRYETQEENGISHFLEHMLFKGTEKRTARQIAEELETVGGNLNAFTSKEYTCFYARVLAEHLPLAADLLWDMFCNSRLAPEDVQKESQVVMEEIRMYEDSPDDVIHDLFAATIWPGHPLGRPVLGRAETLSHMDNEILRSYYRRSYQGSRVVMAVAGGIKAQESIARLQDLSAALPGEPEVLPAFTPPQASPAFAWQEKDTEQVQICLGVPGLKQEDERLYTMQIMNNILGGGLSSRLFQRVREEHGLAYSVYSYHSTYQDGGLLSVYAATAPERAEQVIRLALGEVGNLVRSGVTAEEVERSKQQMRGSLLLGQESMNNRMSRLGKTESCFGRVITVEEVLEHFQRVTVEDVMELARGIFQPGQFTLSCIGPAQEGLGWPALLEEASL